MDLEHHSHGYGQCAYHIALMPRYRHKIFLDAGLQKRCADILHDIATEEGFVVHELNAARSRASLPEPYAPVLAIRRHKAPEMQLGKETLR